VFKRELTPTWLGLVALLAGQRAAHPGRGLTVAYLGSSSGVTPAVIAAAHPDTEVWAWDWRPRAVEAVRILRDGAQLSNLLVHEHATLPVDPVPTPFDIVVLEHVVDSVAADLRQQVVGWVGEHLRPGGIVALSYKTTVGWSEIVPVQRLVRHLATQEAREPIPAVADAIALLGRLQTGGAGFLAARPSVAAWVDDLSSVSADVVVDEYVERELAPTSHARISAAMSELGCVYLGSAALADDLGLQIPARTATLIAAARTRTLRESYGDLAVRRTSRTDVFRLGSSPLSRVEQATELAALHLVGLRQVRGPLEAVLSDEMQRALASGTLAAAALDPDLDNARALVRQLVDAGFAHPSNPDAARSESRRGIEALNEALATHALADGQRVTAHTASGSATDAREEGAAP
jgi:hypothetical protein